MKTLLIYVFLLLTITIIPKNIFGGTCSGSASCGACKTCNYCQHCSGDGGTCGVCGGGDSSPVSTHFNNTNGNESAIELRWLMGIVFGSIALIVLVDKIKKK